MGKKRIIKKSGGSVDSGARSRQASKMPKKRVPDGILHIQASYNNTMMTLTDQDGNTVIQASSGALGFRGSKKGTPYAAGKVGELLAEKAQSVGLKSVSVIVKGVGAGRESAIRSFITQGVTINSITDSTPIPFNGPKAPKPRRV